MNCPHCSHENIDGVDVCAECEHDLTFLDEPVASSPVEQVITEEPLGVLHPRKPICVAPDTRLDEVIQTLITGRIGCVLVVGATGLVGIFTERDLLMKLAGRENEQADQPVSKWMTPNPETVEEDDSIAFAIHKMDVGGYRHLPVMQAGAPCGVISAQDVIRHLAEYLAPVKD